MNWVLAQCQSFIAAEQGFYIALLVTGVFGGMTHCAGMCGPLVLGQVSARMHTLSARDMTELKRVQGALLLPYHFGRITTYAILGVIAACLMATLRGFIVFKYVSAVMLICAAWFFIASAMRVRAFSKVQSWLIKKCTRCLPANVLHWFSSCAKSFFVSPIGVRGYGLGMLLGFMPCGLVYGALMAVAATGDVVRATLGMGLFGLGTLPSLFVIGLVSQGLLHRNIQAFRVVSRGIMVINGMFLLTMAGKILLT